MKWFIIQETIFTRCSSILYHKFILLFSSALNVCNIRIIENIIDTTPPWHINTKYQNIRVSVCFNGIALTHVAVNLTLVLYSSSSPFRQDGLHCEFLYIKNCLFIRVILNDKIKINVKYFTFYSSLIWFLVHLWCYMKSEWKMMYN